VIIAAVICHQILAENGKFFCRIVYHKYQSLRNVNKNSSDPPAMIINDREVLRMNAWQFDCVLNSCCADQKKNTAKRLKKTKEQKILKI
jgi:hypothetical protein